MDLKERARAAFPSIYGRLGAFKRALDLRTRREARARLDEAIRANDLFPAQHHRRPHGLHTPLVVSLTSYSKRFETLERTIKSLIDQSVRPDHLVLWLGERDLPLLPPGVRALEGHGLEIRESEDSRSATKLLPSLEAFPEATVVTADDDLYYEPQWLERLVEASRNSPGDIIGYRAHMAQVDAQGTPTPYRYWEFETQALADPGAGSALFLTGVAGVLYPPHSLHPDVLDRELYLELCPRADDIWFFAMALKQGTRRRRLDHRLHIVEWPSSQDNSLNSHNYHDDGNDVQFAALLRRYPEVATLMGGRA